jgi:eukaryotic-like serine/threonine-protein kinase
MKEWTADELSQRIFDLQLLNARQLEGVWAELRTRNVSLDEFRNRLLGKELLTNLQLDKVLKGDRDGYFYGAYRVTYVVGAGTFARVFRSIHTENGRVAAVKVLRRRYRQNPEQVELFLREARMGMQLRHPNVVRIHEVSSDIQAPYMVMDFVEGQTLREFLQARKKLSVETALSLMIDVAAGLDYARKLGITHRDMKLSNVLVASSGHAKLVDFGLATMTESDDKLLATSPNARSIDYVALERGTGVPKNDPRSDIYFAGCMLYHMLTGAAPLFETRDRLMRMNVSRFQEIKPILKLAPELPANVVSVVGRAMTFTPDGRYQEPGEMLADLKRTRMVLGHEPDQAAEDAAGAAPGQKAPARHRPSKPERKPERKPATQEGAGKTVMFVESNAEMQDLFRDQLKNRGYRVLITNDPDHAVQRFENQFSVADCAVFSTQELGPRAVAAFNRLGTIESTQHVPAILLVNPRHRELVKAAQTTAHRVLLALPVSIKDLRVRLIKLLSAKAEH